MIKTGNLYSELDDRGNLKLDLGNTKIRTLISSGKTYGGEEAGY
jgi:hypothetical protein